VNPAGEIVGKIPETNHRSYHISALMLYPGFMSVDKLAGSWAFAVKRQKAGDIGPMIDFVNSELGEVWVEAEASTDSDALREHIEPWRASPRLGRDDDPVIPYGVRVITAGVDVQVDHFRLAVFGWGVGFECWLLNSERIETDIVGDGPTADMDFSPLAAALAATYRRDGAEDLPISLAFIDSQYRTDQVYEFCSAATAIDCWPAGGDDKLRDSYFAPTEIKSRATPTHRRRKLARAGLRRWRLSTLLLKSRIARLMNVPAPGPGYMHLPADTSETFLDEITSEHLSIDRKRNRFGKVTTSRIWVVKPGRSANHFLDCSYYALAAAMQRGAGSLKETETAAPAKRRGRRITKLDRFS
jgi:phage terminase large subunit GpA-like protein